MYLVNQSFDEGIFPGLLKTASVKPVHKKDQKSLTVNYRPIAILPTFAKIFEKAMSNRVYKFLEKYQILDESQNGFRKSKSTTLAVYKYIQAAINNINKKTYSIGLLLDMTKAYDRVSYDILLNKLYGCGIRGCAYNWFKSYLANRKQLVRITYNNYEIVL